MGCVHVVRTVGGDLSECFTKVRPGLVVGCLWYEKVDEWGVIKTGHRGLLLPIDKYIPNI